MKYLVLKNSNELNEIITFLNSKIGLPQIHRRLNIFSVKDDFQIEILDNKIYYIDKYKKKYNYIKNKNLKLFFKDVEKNNPDGFYINDIVLLAYKDADLLFNTYHGNIIKTENTNIIKELIKKFDIEKYDSIQEHENECKKHKEQLFDEMGYLNSKIREYAVKTGLDIRTTSISLRTRLANVSNDYSYIEKNYKKITGTDLLSTKSIDNNYKFKEISIIIPVYNQSVLPTLYSIEGQNLDKKDKQKIQVIIIDDGSKKSVYNEIKNIKNEFDFNIDIITLNANMGLSNARNVGISLAKYDLLLFVDSDIILSKNYLFDINVRLQIIPNAIIVAMRKNIEKDDALVKKDNLLKGVEKTLSFDDSRVTTKQKKYHVGWDKSFKDETISILDDTNYFKELSFGSKIGIYDLPSVVTGHNIGINRSLIKNSYPFCPLFKGWGLEDSYFASKLIANGNYVIPMVSSCVYHQNHPPRSGSMKKKREEAKKNFELYNSLLDEIWE